MSSRSVLRAKFFVSTSRLFFENYDVYASLNGGLVRDLKAGTLSVCDKFYLQNFKGIKNLGYCFSEGGKVGLGGDILGFDKYLNMIVKVSPDEPYTLPLSYFEAKPFVYTQAALAPNRSASQPTFKDYLRYSAGFGISFLSKSVANAVAIECYVNLYVNQQKNELTSNFQINFGID